MEAGQQRRWWYIAVAVLLVLVVALIAYDPVRRRLTTVWNPPSEGRETIASRLAQYGPAARGRLLPFFEDAGVAYPPKRLVFAFFKSAQMLEVYAANTTGTLKFIREFRVVKSSGKMGPKLREGDRQVPEGVYGIEYLNPNSSYHLSMAISYPNEFDRERAREDGRTKLGGDIMIHGKNVSIGCLAMGDEAAEDLFVLTADTGASRISVLLSPVDFRHEELPDGLSLPPWTGELYAQLEHELGRLPVGVH